jgi:predicted methyltransferase
MIGESMDIEFIQNDKQRLAIFEDLVKAESTVEQLANKNHIPMETVKDVLYSMEQKGIVAWKGEAHFLTDDGRKLASKINKNAHIDAAPVKRKKGQDAKGERFPGHDFKRK